MIVTPGRFLMDELREHPDAGDVVAAIDRYLTTYGHQGYSLDFVEPTQAEDPSGLFATLNAMVGDEDYDPENQRAKAAAIRGEKFKQISELLSGLEYWQFRYRLWLARRYAPVRDEVSFLLGSCWSVVRPMVFELGRRLVEVGTFLDAEDTFYLVTDELNQALEARQSGKALPQLGALAAERRELREARKKHRAPAVVPEEARANKYIARAESMAAQITNDESNDTMRGFAVSSGQVTAKASVVLGPADFAQDGAGIDPGFAVDHAGMDAAVCPCRRSGYRYGQYPRARFDRRARIWHPGGAGRRQRHRAHRARSADYHRRRRRHGSDPRLKTER